jgi:hypothetical protein
MIKTILKSITALFSSALLFYTIAEDCDSIPDINGMTSASDRFEIYGGEACEKYMVIQWEDYYNNGNEQELRYGTTQSYGTTIDLQPFQRQTPITTTIEDLTPDTKYYAQFYRHYYNNYRHVEFTFTTKAPTGIISYKESLKNNNTLYVKNDMLHISGSVRNNDRIVILNISGKTITWLNATKNVTSFQIPKLAAGLCIIQHMRNEALIGTNKFIVGFK